MRRLLSTTAAVVLLLLAGCRERSREPIGLGIALPERNAAVAELAAEEINARGGIRGVYLRVIRDTIPAPEDEPADLEIRRAESIVAQHPLAVIGHSGSRGSLAAAPVYNEAGVVQVVPTGTSRLLQRAGRWTFALPPDDSAEGAFIARFVTGRLGARRVVVFYVNDEYGVGLRDGLRAGLAPLAPLRELRLGLETPLEALVELALRERPEAVVAAVRANTAAILARLLLAGRQDLPLVLGDGAVALPDLIALSGPAAEGRLYAATFWLATATDSASARLTALVRRRLGRRAVATDALVYDAVGLVAAAVREAGRDPDDVRRYIASLGDGRPPYRGVSGTLGGRAAPPLVMGVVRGGDLVPVEPR